MTSTAWRSGRAGLDGSLVIIVDGLGKQPEKEGERDGGALPDTWEPDEGGVPALDRSPPKRVKRAQRRKDRLRSVLTAYHRQRPIHYQLTLQLGDKHCARGGGSEVVGQPNPRPAASRGGGEAGVPCADLPNSE